MYNETYRQGLESQYTYENVCIVPGGRAGLTRVAAVVGDVYCGYQVPEYTTYSEVRYAPVHRTVSNFPMILSRSCLFSNVSFPSQHRENTF